MPVVHKRVVGVEHILGGLPLDIRLLLHNRALGLLEWLVEVINVHVRLLVLYRRGLGGDLAFHKVAHLLLLMAIGMHVELILEAIFGLKWFQPLLSLFKVGRLLFHPAVESSLELPFHGLLPPRFLFGLGIVL